MNTSDLIDHVAAEADLTKAQAKAIVDGVLARITAAAAKGEEVNLPGSRCRTAPPVKAATRRPARPSRSPPARR